MTSESFVIGAGDGHTIAVHEWRAADPVMHALSGSLSRSGIEGEPPLRVPRRDGAELGDGDALTQG